METGYINYGRKSRLKEMKMKYNYLPFERCLSQFMFIPPFLSACAFSSFLDDTHQPPRLPHRAVPGWTEKELVPVHTNLKTMLSVGAPVSQVQKVLLVSLANQDVVWFKYHFTAHKKRSSLVLLEFCYE